MRKTALIIGVSSQDGSYLAESLLDKDYEVVGTIRRSTSYDKANIGALGSRIKIESADLTDPASLDSVIRRYTPDEIYNFAAQSVPADSWSHPFYTGEVTALGPVRVFEAVRNICPQAKVYQATSREIYGNIIAEYANEQTPIDANNPYGIAKAYAHMMAKTYREAHDMFVCGGILFNHESPRRSLHFVTRKVTVAVACIKNGLKDVPLNEGGQPLVDAEGMVSLGDLDCVRDWGFAKEYVEAAWLMLQRDTPMDYVIGTGTSFSVRDLCRVAFDHVDLEWEDHVRTDKEFMRPTEITALKADSSLAKADLGWQPETSFEDLVRLMVDADLRCFRKNL